MRNQIELLREENNFVKKEIEDLRAATEGDAELIAKAKEEGKELKMLREEVGGFREEVEDGKEAIKEVREMYRREIQVRAGAKRQQRIIPPSYITNNTSHARFAHRSDSLVRAIIRTTPNLSHRRTPSFIPLNLRLPRRWVLRGI
jgi:hypothetical protein